MEFFKFIEIFFDKTKSALSKIVYFIVLIVLLFLINDIFGLSDNWNYSNKIEKIQKIEEIKKNFSKDYTISNENINKLNILENDIYYREPIIYNIGKYLNKISIGEIKIDFWYLLSVQSFWLLVLIVMIPQTYRKGLWELFGMVSIILFLMFVRYYFIDLFYRLIGIDNIKYKGYFNYAIFIVIIVIAAIYGNKTKK